MYRTGTEAAKAISNTLISPQSFNSLAHIGRKTISFYLGRLHKDGLNMIFDRCVFDGYLQGFHSLENYPHGLHGIAEYDFFEGFTFVARITAFMNEFHLFEDGRFSRFTST